MEKSVMKQMKPEKYLSMEKVKYSMAEQKESVLLLTPSSAKIHHSLELMQCSTEYP